jgi:hypothetical protein
MLCEAGFERKRIHQGCSKHGSLRCWIVEKAGPPTARRSGGAVGPIGLAAALRVGA